MAMFPELEQAALKDLLRWFSNRNGKHADEKNLWLEELALQIGGSGPAGIRFLLSSISGATESHLRAILLGLAAVRNPSPRRHTEICNVARSFLDDHRPLVVAEAVDLLNSLACTDARARIDKLRGHSSPYVVGSVLRYLARHFPSEAIPVLIEALASREPIVRQNAIDELDEMDHAPALPAIRRLLRDKDRWVRQAARAAVKNHMPSRGKRRRRESART